LFRNRLFRAATSCLNPMTTLDHCAGRGFSPCPAAEGDEYSRRISVMRILVLACALAASSSTASAAEVLSLRDGDRVVLIGSTLIEREQRYGYWETVLTLRHPDKNITFRNLGWSGDTVWGEARAGFDTPREGFKRLV